MYLTTKKTLLEHETERQDRSNAEETTYSEERNRSLNQECCVAHMLQRILRADIVDGKEAYLRGLEQVTGLCVRQ